MTDIQWTTGTARVGDLLPKGWKRNPRYSTGRTADELKAQLEEFGQYYEVLLDDNGIVDGHQRVAAWHKAHGAKFEVETKTASRPLTEQERERFTLRNHASAVGTWNPHELANWDISDLMGADFATDWLDRLNSEAAMVGAMVGVEQAEADVPDIDFAEYDETAADDVKMCECPECGHKFPA